MCNNDWRWQPVLIFLVKWKNGYETELYFISSVQLPVIMGGLILWFVMLVSLCDALYHRDSPVTCSSVSVECDFCGGYNQTNLIDQVTHVYTLKECRQLCLDTADCQFLSYYDDNAVPVSHLCQLFKSCESVTKCSDCISENMQCFETCGSNIVGDLDENILDLTPNVESELACKELCAQNPQCSFYTYFFGNDHLYHKDCFLLTEFARPTLPCDDCVTGSPEDCNNP